MGNPSADTISNKDKFFACVTAALSEWMSEHPNRVLAPARDDDGVRAQLIISMMKDLRAGFESGQILVLSNIMSEGAKRAGIGDDASIEDVYTFLNEVIPPRTFMDKVVAAVASAEKNTQAPASA